MMAGIVLGCAVLLVAAWGLLWKRSRFDWKPPLDRREERGTGGIVRTVEFAAVDGTPLEGWLFLPDVASPPPLVVLAPGLGGTKEGFYESFARSFVARGIAALVFDYRCFGGSGGLPRHWVSPSRHCEDYEAALDFVKRDLGATVDTSRVALWGSSFSGGTALVVASRRADVRAVIAQCPHLKTPPHLQPRGLAMARYVALVTIDMLRVLPPIYISLFGRPGERVVAASTENPSVDDFGGPLGSDFWRQLPTSPRGGWENRMLARGLATFDEVVPMNELDKVTCPVLFIAAKRDDMVPHAYVEEAHSRLPATSELASFDCGHFDLYMPPVFAGNVQRQGDFLVRALRGSTDRKAA